MNISQNLIQEQKLAITLEMQLSLELLQIPIHELQQVIENALQENPLLEVNEEKEVSDKQAITSDDACLFNEKNKEQIDYKELLKKNESDDYSHGKEYEYTPDKEGQSPINFISEDITLKKYLLEQVMELNESKLVISICQYIIENIDDRGYLGNDISDIAMELNIKKELVESSLKLVQEFTPTGIGARDLKECLKIQLRKKGVKDDAVYRVIDEYLELLADNKFKYIAKKLGVVVEKIQEYYYIIKALEPKPSRGFYTGEVINYSIPEAYIRKIGTEYYILMNDNILPKLNVNQLYKDIIKSDKDEKTVEYVKGKLNSAIFLIKSIDRRNTTIYKILVKIIELQREYFDFGDAYLKPMTINDIADRLKYHQSTISRAIKDKYISIPSKTIKI